MSTNQYVETGDLLLFLKSISPGVLRRAPGTSRAKFPSPRSNYKPVLLLAVLQRVCKGSPWYQEGIIRYAPCTEDFARLYDSCYGAGTSKPVQTKVTQAFWYLGAGTPQVWNLVPNKGQEKALANAIRDKEQIKVQKRLTDLVSHAVLPSELMKLLGDMTASRAIIAYLKQEYFAPALQESLDRTLSMLK